MKNGILALSIVCLFAESAFAQIGSELATRHELLDQAMGARERDDHQRALDLAERAGQIRMTASLRYFIAEEQAALSLVTDALASAETCVREVGREPASRNRNAVEANCRRLTEQLRARTGFVVVAFPNVPAGVIVNVAGHPVPPHLWGVPYVVGAGRVIVEARADGYVSYREEILVPPTRTLNVEIRMSPQTTTLVVTTTVPVRHTLPANAAPASPRVAPPPATVRMRTVRSPAGLVIGSFGLAALAAGAGLGLYANAQYDEFRANCVSQQRCPDRASAPDNIRLLDIIATSSFIGGGVLLATGAILYLAVTRTETLPAAVPVLAFDPASRHIGLGWSF